MHTMLPVVAPQSGSVAVLGPSVLYWSGFCRSGRGKPGGTVSLLLLSFTHCRSDSWFLTKFLTWLILKRCESLRLITGQSWANKGLMTRLKAFLMKIQVKGFSSGYGSVECIHLKCNSSAKKCELLEFLHETLTKASPASVCPFLGVVLKVLPKTFFNNRCQDISWDIFWIGTSIWRCILRSCDLASLSAGWLILMRQAQQFAEQRYMLIRSYYWADSLL